MQKQTTYLIAARPEYLTKITGITKAAGSGDMRYRLVGVFHIYLFQISGRKGVPAQGKIQVQ